MNKSLINTIMLFTSIYLNAEEVVSLVEDKNIINVPSTIDSRENDDVQFALELGAKTDFWNPGLSKEEGGEELLNYDTEGLYLGYAKFKTKIYGTDVLTLEKFGTLESSDSQSKLLNAYKNDRKEDSSYQGIRASIQVMKIMNYLFDTNILDGLEYSYTTKNFIGSATLEKNSIYWFGNNPGDINTDYLEYDKNKVISFQTKFTNQELLYRFGNLFDTEKDPLNKSSMKFMLGIYAEDWEKPTYIGTRFNGKPVLFDGKYKSKGALLGLELGSETLNMGFKWYIGIDNEFQLTNNYSAKDNFDRNLGMQKGDIYFVKKYSKIYSTNYFDVGFLIQGNAIYSEVTNGSSFHQEGTPEPEKKDAETLYGIGLAFDITF